MLEDKNFIEVYKQLYPDFPNENALSSQTERDMVRIEAYEEFIQFKLSKLLGA